MWWMMAALAADDPCPGDLRRCLEGDAPLEVRRAALRGVDPRDTSAIHTLRGLFLDGPLREDLVVKLVEAGVVPGDLAGRVPSRTSLARALGSGKIAVEHCRIEPDSTSGTIVSCMALGPCKGSCYGVVYTARWDGISEVIRGEEQADFGQCGCCMSVE